MRQRLQLTDASSSELHVPETLRNISSQLAQKRRSLQEKHRSLLEESRRLSSNIEEIERYVAQRETFATEAQKYCKELRAILRTSRDEDKLDEKSAKRLRGEIDDLESIVSKERALVATNRTKLEYGTLAHSKLHCLGEAYMATIVENLALPAGATMQKQGTRDEREQANFRSRVKADYHPPGLEEHYSWCPVTRTEEPLRTMTTAHIVPYAVGELNAAYLFGLELQDGYKAIWDTRNRLWLPKEVEQDFDKAKFVIAPCAKDEVGELEIIVLDETILGVPAVRGVKYGDIDGKPLEFRTSARPGLRNLYLHCLMALFRRRRFGVHGWEKDWEKVITGRVWGSSDEWLRRSVLEALALEVGDVVDHAGYEDMLAEKNGVKGDLPGNQTPERDGRVALCIRGGWETLVESEDWKELEDDLVDEKITVYE